MLLRGMARTSSTRLLRVGLVAGPGRSAISSTSSLAGCRFARVPWVQGDVARRVANEKRRVFDARIGVVWICAVARGAAAAFVGGPDGDLWSLFPECAGYGRTHRRCPARLARPPPSGRATHRLTLPPGRYRHSARWRQRWLPPGKPRLRCCAVLATPLRALRCRRLDTGGVGKCIGAGFSSGPSDPPALLAGLPASRLRQSRARLWRPAEVPVGLGDAPVGRSGKRLAICRRCSAEACGLTAWRGVLDVPHSLQALPVGFSATGVGCLALRRGGRPRRLPCPQCRLSCMVGGPIRWRLPGRRGLAQFGPRWSASRSGGSLADAAVARAPVGRQDWGLPGSTLQL